MKVYISVDIEGCAGITHWDEAEKSHADYPEFREQMTREAVAAIEGAMAAGARDIWVKDAHDSGRNLLAAKLPKACGLSAPGPATPSAWCRNSTRASMPS